MFHFKCSSELLPDGVVGDGVQEDDVPGDGHVRRQVVPHVLHHRLPGHAGSLRTNVKTGVVRKCPIRAYLGQHYGRVYDVITDELIVLALNSGGDNFRGNHRKSFLPRYRLHERRQFVRCTPQLQRGQTILNEPI